jgi:N-acyl homoserine lactone hydrolase
MHHLFILSTGQLTWDDPALEAPVPHPVPAYLILASSGRTILVDTGNPRSLIGRLCAKPWADMPLLMTQEDDLASRLNQLRVRPADVDLLISTHFDFDHCGNHDLFDHCGVRSLVQQRHLETALTDRRYERKLWRRPAIEYVPVDGDHEIEPGIVLLETGGHAPGHQSVLVETGSGTVILAIDAIDDRLSLGPGPYPDFYFEDRAQWEESRDRLVRMATACNGYLIFGHDTDQWLELPKSPQPFSRPFRSDLFDQISSLPLRSET